MKSEIVLFEVFRNFLRSLLKFVITFILVRIFLLLQYVLQELNYSGVLYTSITFFLIKLKLRQAGQKKSTI